MRSKIIFAIFVFTVSIIFSPRIFAETIYLRDGSVIKEKIVERGDYYVTTMKGNMPTKYYTGQIERIEEDEPDPNVANMDSDEGMSEEKAQLINGFINASGVRASMEQNIEQVISRAQEDKKEEFREIFNIDEIIERLVPVYSKYYTKEDLQAIVQFYDGPAGKKVLENTPQIMKEAASVTIQYVTEKKNQQ